MSEDTVLIPMEPKHVRTERGENALYVRLDLVEGQHVPTAAIFYRAEKLFMNHGRSLVSGEVE